MSEDNVYQDAEIVWVKLRSCWWPGEVCSHQRQPDGLLKHSKRKPYCVVKFFQEESFECVKNAKMIYPFNCSKKDEFIRKGHALLAKNKYMEQFPAAVSTAERLTRSLTRSSLFFNSRPDSIIKAILTDSSPQSERIRNGRQCEIVDKILQTKPSPTTDPNQSQDLSPTYKCSICDFQSTRQNVMVLHRRSHSGSGTTPQRNSFVSRSIISSLNAKEIQKSPEIDKEDENTPKARVKRIINETAAYKEIELPHAIKSGINELESNLINTVYNKNLAHEVPSKQNSDKVSTVFIRPPPKKQLNFINCKSENIQKSLLADWIDEEKDDDDENEEDDKKTKQIEVSEITTNLNKSDQYSSISVASTSASAEKIRQQESAEQISSVALIELQKPISKIRNIPKKDRRNIVFTDFNETEDITHMPFQAQKPTVDVCSQKHFNEVEIPMIAKINADLLTEEPLNINIEEIPTSKIFECEEREKTKLSSDATKSNKVKLPARKSTRHEVSIFEEASVEVLPAGMSSLQVEDLQVLGKVKNDAEVADVDVILTATEKEVPAENCITEEKNTVENCTLQQTTQNITEDLNAGNQATVEEMMVELFRTDPPNTVVVTDVDLVIAEPTALKSTTEDMVCVESEQKGEGLEDFLYRTAEESMVETNSVELTTLETATVEPLIKESTTAGYNVGEEPTLKSILLKHNTVESHTEAPTTTETIIIGLNTEEQSSVESYADESTKIEQNSLKPFSVESSTVELDTVEPATEQSATIEPSLVEPSTVEPSTVEPSTVEPSTVEPSTVEPSTVEPSIVEPSTVEPSTVEPSTVEPSTVEPPTVEPTTEEPSTVEPSTVEPSTVEPSIVEPSTIEPSTVEPSTVEPSTVELYTVEPSTVEPSTVEPSSVEPSTVEPSTILNRIEPFIEETTTVQPNIIEPKTVEPTTVDKICTDINSTKFETIPLETSGAKLDFKEITNTSFKIADASEKKSNPEKSIPTEQSSKDHKILESITGDFSRKNISLVNISSSEYSLVKSSSIEFSAAEQLSISSNTNVHSTVTTALQSEEFILPDNSVELNQPESIADNSSSKNQCLSEHSNQEFFYADKPSSSKTQYRKKNSNKNSFNTCLEERNLSSSETEYPAENNKQTFLQKEDTSEDNILKEKYCSADAPIRMNSSDEVPKVNTLSKSKNSADVKKKFKEQKPALRLSTPRECKRDTFEAKETFVKRRTTKASAKKMTLLEKMSCNEKQRIDSCLESCKDVSLTMDESTSIETNDEKFFNKIPTEEHYVNKENSNKPAVEEISIQTAFEVETTCNLTSESVKVDEATCVVEHYVDEKRTAEKLDAINNPEVGLINSVQSTESKSRVPVYLEPEDENTISELNESKPRSSFSKASLACFDFNEEEDILTSIANFKKTYVSPEKSYNFGLDNRPKTPDAQKLDLEMKDKQLSADIESLLKTTTIPVNLASSSSFSNRPFSNEVRGLPIKERGKRIFKSRNRFRFESCPSVSTTSTAELKSVSLSLSNINTNVITPIEISKKVGQIEEVKKIELAKENFITSQGEANVDDMKGIEEKTMDDKVTNSEEEIIARIVFSPTEVFATSNEEALNESVQAPESIVSSSGMEVNSESLLISNENVAECANNIISAVDNSDEQNPTFSCEPREKNEKVGDENEEFTKGESNEESNAISANCVDQIVSDDFNKDLKKDEEQESKSYDFESSTINENNPIKYVDNIEQIDVKSKLLDEQANPMEDSYNANDEERNELVYDKELCADEEIVKTNDPNFESPFEYELVTTEVSTIVDHISNDEQNLDNGKESSTEVSEEVVSCCDDGTFLNEMIIADVIESQSSVAENETDNPNMILNYTEKETSVIENPVDESNSGSMNGFNANEETDIHVSNIEDGRLQVDVEHAETSSDDSSSIISDAEAEFGSPTSMLEEERVFKRTISGSETPAISTEGKGNKTLKKSNRKNRYQLQNSLKENKLIIQSLQCDTQESTSNDVVNELVHDASKYGTDPKECLIEPNNSFCNKPFENASIEKATANNDLLLGKHRERLPENDKDMLDSSYENSDSSEEDEEEICSPPIEPLIDEDTEVETIENYSTTTSLSKSEGGPQIDCEVVNTADIVPDFQIDNSEKSTIEDKVSEHNFENTNTGTDEPSTEPNEKQPDYTIIQKSDTIIKLNKHEEKSTNEMVVTGWTETSVDVRKSELAGEELSAAEALLLIPNQATNILETDLIKKPMDSVESLAEVENLQSLLAEEEIKEETPECSDPAPGQDLELDTKDDTPKELVRRKRRSHMKVTPRKRMMSVSKLEAKNEEEHIEAKVAKLANRSMDSDSKFYKSSETPELTNKSPAEQYEESFVLKYIKEQLKEEMDSVELNKIDAEDSEKTPEKQTLEKVQITVDISNPLSSQIATILGTNRPSTTEVPIRCAVKKRKQSVEDDIPSFIIKRPCPKTVAEEEAADRETIAQIQNLCPQVEITRKPSKDDQRSSTPTSQQATTKPQIINQQILRAGNNQPLITVTAKGNKNEEGIFDISNMPIVLSNEKIVNEKVHLVITPTTNPQIIKQFQNQQQTQLSNTETNTSNFSGNISANVPKPGIPARRPSCVRTKRTPSRQQLPEQQQNAEVKNFEQENYQQPLGVQQQAHQQQEYVHPHQQIQQIQHEHNQLQQQRQNLQVQLQPQNQFQQQLQQQQFQHHHQNQMQQQLQEEQNILIQQHHQLLLQQQLQLEQLQNQHQLVTNEKSTQSNLSEKQIGIDNRGNKYVIIRNPSNTVVMSNSPEPCKVSQQRVSLTTTESCDQNSQRKQRQKKHSPLTVQTGTSSKSPLPLIPPLPDTSPPPHILSITSTQTNQPQQYLKDQHINSPSIPVTSAATTKPKGRGRGRPPKNKTETVSSTKQCASNNVKINANGRRSTGRICEPPRQRSTRSLAVTTSAEVHQTVMSPATVYSANQQQTQSVGFMINPQFTSMPIDSSPSIRANNESYQAQTLGLSPQSRPSIAPEIDSSEVSGGGYAVPSLPVPGYPQTYLLCELIGNKYKEVYSKPLYLSPDRTRFLEVPDELVTEAHTKLSDSRREPNPNALKLVSDGTPHILQSRLIEINSENMVSQNDGSGQQQNEALMQKHQQLSVEEQASALLCLQEQLTQDHLGHKQISQEQLVQEQLVQDQLVQEQFVEEQFVQEQFVQEQFVQEQFVPEQFVQEQFVQEQFVQEQFVQEQFVPEQFVQEQFNLQPQQFSLQLARFETGEVIEDAERGQMMVVTTGTHNMILDDKSFFEFTGEKKIDFYNAEKDTYVLTPQVISSLLHHYALGHITAVPAMNTEIGDQQEVSIADVIQNTDSSTNILEVALDESGLYSEEQFINTGQILQIETPEGMQLIGTAAENADLIFHHMTKANTNETNVLLNQAPKMSAVEIPSDKSKRRFETKPSTPATLEDCLNVIGVQSPNVPTSLELPASVTNPAIVAKTRTPTPGTITMNEIIATGLCHHPDITSLPSMSTNDQELSYEFFQSNTEAHEDKGQVNEESVVTDMGEYAVVTSSASFDDPGR